MKCVVVAPLVACLLVPSIASGQVGTAFNYQGRLLDGGAPATGTVDVQMVLYDAPVGGSQQGPIVTLDNVTVNNGLFTATIDFGDVFYGVPRFLEIGMRPGVSTGSYSILSPRQMLTPTPIALFSADAATATTVAGLTCANNEVAKWSGTGWTCGADDDLTPPSASAPLTTIGNAFTLSICSPNQIYKMSGSTWVCANDVDTNTTYSAGTGLQLVGTQFSIDTNVARKDAAAGNQAFDTNTLLLDYTNNRVGIGTTPFFTLDVFGTFNLAGGVAAADLSGTSATIAVQDGGADGADGNDSGGAGGSLSLIPGAPGVGRTAGDFAVIGVTGGAGTPTVAGQEGSDVLLNAGGGGTSAFGLAGGGGDVAISGGAGGSSGVDTGGIGGGITVTAGNGGTEASGGNLELTAGTGNGTASGGNLILESGNGGITSGTGGDIVLTAGVGSGGGGGVQITSGTSSSGPGGEITLSPGQSTSGIDGVIQLGAATSQANSSGEGRITAHLVLGDLNITGAGDGIILRNPLNQFCRLLRLANNGALELIPVTCP